MCSSPGWFTFNNFSICIFPFIFSSTIDFMIPFTVRDAAGGTNNICVACDELIFKTGNAARNLWAETRVSSGLLTLEQHNGKSAAVACGDWPGATSFVVCICQAIVTAVVIAPVAVFIAAPTVIFVFRSKELLFEMLQYQNITSIKHYALYLKISNCT